MKIIVDNEEVYELNKTKEKVIKNDILEEVFDADMKRRVRWSLNHKYERCFERLVNEWCKDHDGKGSKLEKNGIRSIPTNPDELAELIFSQPNYKNRTQRERDANPNSR
jgi:hypothetical protein